MCDVRFYYIIVLIIGRLGKFHTHERFGLPDMGRNHKRPGTVGLGNEGRPGGYKVYMKTDDMLYSGGNGSGLSYYIKYAEGSTKPAPTDALIHTKRAPPH